MVKAAFLLLLLPAVLAANFVPRPSPPLPKGVVTSGPVKSRNGSDLPPIDTYYYFDQLIDHNNPSKGTFKQRYYFTAQFYQPGGPIVVKTPGEIAITGYQTYLTNHAIMGVFMNETNGAGVILEHRFYGTSDPGPDLSAKSLNGLHTIDQAIDDLVYFSQHAVLPMTGGDQVTSDKAAWILIGGSYAGALTSWTMHKRPGIFWAGYASSAVVETINYFWQLFDPVRQFMPQNCSADVQAVIQHIDQTFTNGTDLEKSTIKNTFGLQDLDHLDDVVGALRNPLWDWQGLQPDSGPNAQFFQFCDALEVKNGVSAPAGGWGLTNAINAWGNYYKTTYLNYVCGTTSVADCLGTYDTSLSYWSNVTLGQDQRSWLWMVCNQVGWLQDGAPNGWPTTVSRLITPIYDERQCEQYWPDFFPKPPTPNTAATNSELGGWDTTVDRLFYANGQRDPWRDATVSSDYHNRQSSGDQIIYESDGFHCSDLLTPNTLVDSTVNDVYQLGIAYLGKWLQEWRAQHPGVSNASNFNLPDPSTLPKPPTYTPQPIPSNIWNAPPPALPSSVTGSSGPPRGPIRNSGKHANQMAIP